MSNIRIGYAPISDDFRQPGDRRRFVFYAKERNISFEIADPSRVYDLVVISQKADLSVWSKYEPKNAKLIYDSIDSYLAIPRTSVTGWLRGPAKYFSGQSRHFKFNHWKTIGEMCSRADAVICSTKEQERDIANFCSNTHIILDAHFDVACRVKTVYQSHRPFRFVWEGLPQNLYSLRLLSPVFSSLSREHQIELHVVTDASFNRYLGKYWKVNSREIAEKFCPNIVFHDWCETTFADIICGCDAAVIPINLRDSFATGKPENKLLLLWRMGMPVVTSSSPAYLRAMAEAGMNYTASDNQTWLRLLAELITREDARENAGLLGKRYTVGQHSMNHILWKWDQLFSSIGIPVNGV